MKNPARKYAAPMVDPKAGMPLIKSVPSLGRMLEWRKGRSVVDEDMPDHLRKEHVRRDTEIFIKWMEKEDGARFRGQVRVHGPFPHFEANTAPVMQTGDRGGTRQLARSIVADTSNNGKEDYVIECLFDVPEAINEIPTSLALDLFSKGTPNLRPLREKDFRGRIDGIREYRSRNN